MSFYTGFAGKFFKTMREIERLFLKGKRGLFLKESGIIVRRKLFQSEYSGRKCGVTFNTGMCMLRL